MIANITAGSFLKPLIEYNMKKVKKGEATILDITNTFSNDVNVAASIIDSFGNNSRRKDKFHHVSLNFSKEDTAILTDEKLKKIAKEYLKEMGFPEDHVYIAFKHDDTEHPHIHLVTSRILQDGKVNKLADRFKHSQDTTRKLEQKYNLKEVSSVKIERETSIKLDPTFTLENHPLVDVLNYHVNFALKHYKADSLKSFVDYLNKNNIDVNILEGFTPKGTPYKGIVYNQLTSNFKQSQKGISASKLKNKPTFDKIEPIFKRNKEFHTLKKKKIKVILENILFKYSSISLQDLEQVLADKGIKLNTKFDSTNKLVGISFEDINTKYLYTGENIGKDFTAKNWVTKISTATTINPQITTLLNYNKYKAKITNKNEYQEAKNLLQYGFKINITNNGLYITDYKLNAPNATVLLRAGTSLTNEDIAALTKSINIDFDALTKENKLLFESNRNPEFKQDLKEDTASEIANTPYFENEDSFVNQESEATDNYQISDIDKKKRKPNKRKLQ